MPTELPYAADAEESLSYDELEVRVRILLQGSRLHLHVAWSSKRKHTEAY